MKIEELKKNDEGCWDEFVKKSDTATFYHLIGWKNAIERSYKHKPIYLIAKDNGEIKGILPLFLLQSRIFGNRLISVPFGPYGGAIAEDINTEEMLIEYAKNIVKNLHLDFLELRNLRENKDLISNETYFSWFLKLDKTEILMKKFNRNVKRNIQKINKKLDFIDHNENLANFYSLYCRKMHEFGTPSHSFEFIKNIFVEFPTQTGIATVLYEEQPIAAQLYFTFKETVILVWLVTPNEYLNLGTNYFIFSKLFKKFYEEGYKYLDFGRSILQDGIHDYKEDWGTEPKKLFYQYYVIDKNKVIDYSRGNPKRHKFSKIWNNIPLPLANAISPIIRRQFP